MNLFVGKIEKNIAKLSSEESHHIIKVLRMNEGNDILVTDGKGNMIKGKLHFQGKQVFAEIEEIFPQKKQKTNSLHIAIAPTKNIDRFEFFIEKSVELGIDEISPILCKNSERKILNSEKIIKQSVSACKQSMRSFFPIINSLVTFKDFLEKNQENLFVAHCYEDFEKITLEEVFLNNKNNPKTTILIGPEGDFSKQEITELLSKNIKGISLGTNRLRTETSGIYIASVHHFLFDK